MKENTYEFHFDQNITRNDQVSLTIMAKYKCHNGSKKQWGVFGKQVCGISTSKNLIYDMVNRSLTGLEAICSSTEWSLESVITRFNYIKILW